MLLEALKALSPVPQAAARADDLRVIVGRTDHSWDKATHVDKSPNTCDKSAQRQPFWAVHTGVTRGESQRCRRNYALDSCTLLLAYARRAA